MLFTNFHRSHGIETILIVFKMKLFRRPYPLPSIEIFTANILSMLNMNNLGETHPKKIWHFYWTSLKLNWWLCLSKLNYILLAHYQLQFFPSNISLNWIANNEKFHEILFLKFTIVDFIYLNTFSWSERQFHGSKFFCLQFVC